MPTAIPMMSTTSATDELAPTGSQWLGMASSEIAIITAVAASSSGMPAAISAPNTTSSRTSETGTEVISAFLKSLPVLLLMARSTLAPPASPILSPGWCAWTAATALSAGTTALSSLSGLPATSKVTSVEFPLTRPRLVAGDWMSAAAAGSAFSAATTSRTACLISGSWP